MAKQQNHTAEMKKSKPEKFRIEDVPLTEDTTCGFGPFKGPFLQRYATKTMYVVLYGALGLVHSATWSYLNGTISTMEKRFKIPSRITGIIMSGSDVSGFFTSVIFSYWAGKGHRPRWIAFNSVITVIHLLLMALPHAIYGAGDEALKHTFEYDSGNNYSAMANITTEKQKTLCGANEHCVDDAGSFVQPAILFLSQFIQGFGGGLYYTVGMSYMDDNVNKSQSPVLVSVSFLLRMIGPTLGYLLATICLKVYISPHLTPTISTDDPRWLGAWWMGWVILAAATAVFAIPMSLFPKVLPETEAKRAQQNLDEKRIEEDEPPASFRDMATTIKRLLGNKIYFCNTFASIFYVLGETPYWVYIAKYIETQYKQTASVASFVSGTMNLICSSIGIMVSGIVITKLKPNGRALSAWNVFVALATAVGFISYTFVVCDDQTFKSAHVGTSTQFNTTLECNIDCDCTHMPYSPVCSETGQTFISACHAGCRDVDETNGTVVYTNCACVNEGSVPGTATPGLCAVDCTKSFYSFLAIISFLRMIGGAGIATNFLVNVRCIDEKDKSAAMGLSLTLLRILSFTPSPILYGYLMDTTCIVWGKTCTGTGNCWLYDGPSLAYVINLTGAAFIVIGSTLDMNVWFHSKNLKIFD